MEIKILHLYSDFMNLYGEYGNVRLLTKSLEDKGCAVLTEHKTITDSEIDFENYDFIYCGAGTESKRTFALNHLKRFKDSLKSAFDSGKVMLFTGNSWEMLGKSIESAEGKTIDGLNLFDFTVKEQSSRRLTGDIKAKAEFLDNELIGFINKCSEVSGVDSPLFTLTMKPESFAFETEGIHCKNFFGTQIVGPVLVKNPAFCNYIAELIIENN
ncbi:MAG: glutamine amidotransferase [Ruminococcaceae bacterium]|nr:glutamine amidotransferase [Oscillospiraceae bacterium]